MLTAAALTAGPPVAGNLPRVRPSGRGRARPAEPSRTRGPVPRRPSRLRAWPGGRAVPSGASPTPRSSGAPARERPARPRRDHRLRRRRPGRPRRAEGRGRRLHRPPPLRARGARRGAQAARHVHRLHRRPRPAAPALGDHRQRGRRGPGRALLAGSRSCCTRTRSVEVRDDGRGIPVDVEPKTGLTGVEVVLTKLHAGGKFGGGSYTASGGLHGVGASVVNALSVRLDVEVDRGAKTHAMSFRRGTPGIFDGEGAKAPFTPADGLRVVGKVPRARTGTRVRYWADQQIFLAGAELDVELLRARARQTAFLVPGLQINLRDQRGRRGRRGAVPLRRRHHRLRRAPRDRPAGDRHPAAAGHRPLHRDRAGPRRRTATWSPPTSSASSGWTSRCAGGPATTPTSSAS